MKTNETGQAIIVQVINGQWKTTIIPHGVDLIEAMEALGFEKCGTTPIGGVLRPELQGQPRFSTLCGPCWGGEETPVRYENSRANDILST